MLDVLTTACQGAVHVGVSLDSSLSRVKEWEGVLWTPNNMIGWAPQLNNPSSLQAYCNMRYKATVARRIVRRAAQFVFFKTLFLAKVLVENSPHVTTGTG